MQIIITVYRIRDSAFIKLPHPLILISAVTLHFASVLSTFKAVSALKKNNPNTVDP